MKDAEPQRPELHVPQPVLEGLQTDRLPGEGFADEHHAAVPLDAAVGTHDALLEIVAVAMLRQAARQRPRRQLVDLARRLHAEDLVRPLVVERLLEAVERLLLRPDRGPRRRRRLGLRRLVEALVPAILVGSPGLDEHRRHARAHEPTFSHESRLSPWRQSAPGLRGGAAARSLIAQPY
jgi:hypothetical protein